MNARRKEHPMDLGYWVNAMQKTLEERAGRKHWRDFMKRVLVRVDDSDALLLEEDPDAHRYLWRLGLVGLGPSGKKAIRELVRKVGEAASLPPVEVTIIIKVFAAGYYGLLDKGVCGDTPECAQCPFEKFCGYVSKKSGIAKLPDAESFASRLSLGVLSALGVPELLALLISGGRNEMKAFRLAEKLLAEAGSLRVLATWSVNELAQAEGVSRETAIRLRAALDLAVYWAAEPRPPGARFSHARDFYKYYKPRLRDLKTEFFIVTMLDSKNRLMGEIVTGGGGLSGTNVDPRAVLKQAIRDAAPRVAFIHNHPSGDTTPSPEDLAITARLVQVCNLVGIKVLDHIIIGADSYLSMSEGGYI